MTEKLAQLLGKEERRIKVGKSFERRDNRTEYNSIRYDFKPVSIDEEKEGTLEVGENNSVAVSLPHVDGAGQTNYKGHMSQSNPKECVLIIDHDTGEITIERLSKQILLKKTRPEKIDNKLLEENINPYAVKLVPDRPSFPGGSSQPRETSVGSTNRKPMESDYQPSQQPARSSPVPSMPKSRPQSKAHGGSSGSMTSLPKSRPPSKAPPSGGVVANSMPNSNLESSSSGSDSSSSSSDDSESDNEDISRAAAAIETGDGGMPTFGGGGGGVLPTSRPQQPRGGAGVLPTARPIHSPQQQRGGVAARPPSSTAGVLPTSARPPPSSTHHKSKKSSMPSVVPTAAAPCLNDDLMLSSDDSDSD